MEDFKILNIRHDDGAGNVDHFYIPARRKSDDAVGWYDVLGDDGFRVAPPYLKAPD